MSPPKGGRESSAPELNPFVIGEMLGEMRSSLKRIEEWQAKAPCAFHAERWAKISSDVAQLKTASKGHRVSEWLATNWKLVIPLFLALLSAPTVRQCVGEQQTEQIAKAVKQLQSEPRKVEKVVVLPSPPAPLLIKPDAQEEP